MDRNYIRIIATVMMLILIVCGATAYLAYCEIQFLEIRNKCRTQQQIAQISNKLLLPTSYQQTDEKTSLTSGMLSQSGLTVNSLANLIDGSTTTQGCHTDSSVAGAYLQIDLGVGNEQSISKMRIINSSSTTAQYLLRASNDLSTWDTVSGTITMPNSNWQEFNNLLQKIQVLQACFTKHTRFWRICERN